ncbi:MAG: hypothetical protein ACE5R6_10450 [Candidatus Heimdallarchaeota archaeon]
MKASRSAIYYTKYPLKIDWGDPGITTVLAQPPEVMTHLLLKVWIIEKPSPQFDCILFAN